MSGHFTSRAATGAGIVAIVLGVLFYFQPSTSHAVHKGAGGLTCGNCHTMHNSQGSTTSGDGNAPLGGNAGGSLVLLRGPVNSRENIHKLCLQCHASNGPQASVSHGPQNVQAPKVYSSGTWTDADAFNVIGAGGNFSTELTAGWDSATTPALGYGHSLGATTVVPPGGDQALAYLTCTSCHDPHGTSSTTSATVNIFRNLKVSAQDAGTNAGVHFGMPFATEDNSGYSVYKMRSYVGGINGTYFGGAETDNAGQVVWPVFRGALTGVVATDSGNTNVYGLDEPPSFDRMASWCSQCHDKWHEDIQSTNKVSGPCCTDEYRRWRRHPVSTTVHRGSEPGCAVGCHGSVLDRVNYSNALIQAGKGLPVSAGWRAGNVWDPGAGFVNFVYYLPWCDECIANTSWSGMEPNIWSGPQVFCLTCHFAHGGPYRDGLRWDHIESSSVAQGSQTGNPIPSTKGCQLCHNR